MGVNGELNVHSKNLAILAGGLILGIISSYIYYEFSLSAKILANDIDSGVNAARVKLNLFSKHKYLKRELYRDEFLKYINFDIDYLMIQRDRLSNDPLIDSQAKSHYKKKIDDYLTSARKEQSGVEPKYTPR